MFPKNFRLFKIYNQSSLLLETKQKVFNLKKNRKFATKDFQIRGVSQIKTHPNDTRKWPYENDIAVLLLESPFPQNHEFIEPISIWKKPDFSDILQSNIPCKTSGWGGAKFRVVRFFF